MTSIAKLKESVEILRFDTSSNEEQYILCYENRRWQVAELVYLICNEIDGEKTSKEIADSLSVSEKVVESVVNDFLANKGLLVNTHAPKTSKKENLNKYLWLKIPLIKGEYILKTKFLKVLYNKKLMISLISLSILIQIVSYINTLSLNDFLTLNVLNLSSVPLMFIILFLSLLTHELGHMAAFMKYDMVPGNIGFGMYFTAPALFSDVSSAWKLSRKQRVLVDIGGMYFEFLFNTILCILGLVINNSFYIYISFLSQINILRNLNPFLKYDGYWVATDLLGIPNLHDKVKGFFIYFICRVFGVKSEFKLSTIRKKERQLFLMFALLNVLYVLFFSSTLVVLFISIWRKIIVSVNISAFLTYSMSQLFTLFKNNIGTLILFMILIRIGITALKGITKGIKIIVTTLKQQPVL